MKYIFLSALLFSLFIFCCSSFSNEFDFEKIVGYRQSCSIEELSKILLKENISYNIDNSGCLTINKNFINIENKYIPISFIFKSTTESVWTIYLEDRNSIKVFTDFILKFAKQTIEGKSSKYYIFEKIIIYYDPNFNTFTFLKNENFSFQNENEILTYCRKIQHTGEYSK